MTFRVDRKLKARMERLKHINWSEMLRNYVQRVVEEEEERLRPKRDYDRIREAIKQMDRIADRTEGSDWIGAEEVIRWRKRRYSYLTQA